MPTMRNPITQRHIEGEGGGVVGEESGSIFVDMDEWGDLRPVVEYGWW